MKARKKGFDMFTADVKIINTDTVPKINKRVSTELLIASEKYE